MKNDKRGQNASPNRDVKHRQTTIDGHTTKQNRAVKSTTTQRVVKPKGQTTHPSHSTKRSSHQTNSTHPGRTTKRNRKPNSPSPSKLSRGPRNPAHKTFLHNEDLINDVLCAYLSKRRIDIKAKEIYTHAGITSPTFYLHYRSSNDARASYERKLLRNFYCEMPPNPKPKLIYARLTNFIAKNSNYFLASAVSGDHYILRQIITNYRQNLVGRQATDRTLRYYIGIVVASINCWLELDGITPETTRACSEHLRHIRPLRW